MNIEKAIAYAMINICHEKGTSPCKLFQGKRNLCLRTKVLNVTTGRVRNPNIKTISQFCKETGYTLPEFFSRKEFENLE